MADLYRSVEMSYLQVIVPEQTSHAFVHQLAVLGVAEIIDVSLFFLLPRHFFRTRFPS